MSSDLRTGFLVGRFCGSLGSFKKKKDKLGVERTVVVFQTLGGNKYCFGVLGVAPDFSGVPPFGVITVEVFDITIGKAGEYGNYGDQNFTCSDMKLVQDRAVASPGATPKH